MPPAVLLELKYGVHSLVKRVRRLFNAEKLLFSLFSDTSQYTVPCLTAMETDKGKQKAFTSQGFLELAKCWTFILVLSICSSDL